MQHADRAKTRLQVPDGVWRPELARAIALDSLAAVRRCPLVGRRLVVTSDPVVADRALSCGDEVLPDPGEGLTAAIAAGVAHGLGSAVTRRAAALGVLLADVPAAQPEDLAIALTAASGHPRTVLPDLDGVGSVLLTARPGQKMRPAFGPGSAGRHVAGGARRLDLDLPRLRRDVDTAANLAQAESLGLGPATSRLLPNRRAACR
ncbi:MAG: 2-phospho-L-lactate guanylyltransferase [Angustibacter sp.]